MSVKTKASPESIVRDIKRKTRRKFTAEEKIRIVLAGLRGEEKDRNFLFGLATNPLQFSPISIL